MGRHIRSVVIASALMLALAVSLAWAASKPTSKGSYFSSTPAVSLSIQVVPPGRSVLLYTSCGSDNKVSESWTSPHPVSLRHDAFSYNKRSSVGRPNGGPIKTNVLFTGTFEHGEFKGKVHIAGSSCTERSYTTRFDKGGGST